MTINEKRLAFLEETANHYTSKNRCEYYGTCRYAPIDGSTEGCAIGRKIPIELAKKLDEVAGNVAEDKIFNLLPIDLADLGRRFLCRVQILHDFSEYWCEEGLSAEGLARVESIKKEVYEGSFD